MRYKLLVPKVEMDSQSYYRWVICTRNVLGEYCIELGCLREGTFTRGKIVFFQYEIAANGYKLIE